MENMNHLTYLQSISNEDLKEIVRKEGTYKGSWKKRGGVGAFMMMARKWDRIEGIVETRRYDVFDPTFISTVGQDGTLIAEIRDLRRYLMLVEAEICSRETGRYIKLEPSIPGTPDDGGHHARFEEEQPV